MAKPARKRLKRMNGEGALHQRPNGSWEMRIMDGFREDGRKRYKSFYGRTAHEVEEKVKAYQNRGLNSGDDPDFTKDYPFEEWGRIWLNSHKSKVSPTTFESYQYTLRILNRFFEGKRLSEIKAYHVESMLHTLQQEGRSTSGLAQCRGMLYQIMNKAEANDLIRKNPVRYAEKMRHTGSAREKEAFTSDEVAQLMRELPYSKIGISIRLMLGTGMRTQELLALEPRHIEPDGSCVHIRQALKMLKGTSVIGTPKSRDSYRDVPVPVNLRWCAVKLRDGGKQFIWESPRNPGQPVNPSHFREQFRKALEAISEVRVLTPHSCRHTYVSQLQALGVDLATVQALVGHADLKSIQRTYLHVQDEVKARAIGLFSDAFPAPQGDFE